MIRIAICDDEWICLDNTKRFMEQWSAQSGVPVRIDCFDNGDALLAKVRTARMDIIFLDIVMPLLNGMDTAREIRELDKTIPILFLTSSPEFALESYSVKANGYLLKPVQYEQIVEVLNDCATALREEPKHLLLKSDYGYQKIYLREIEYIEAQNKRVLFYLQSGEMLTITEPLRSFEIKLFAQDGFYKCHRSYIVSLPFVNSFNASQITMKSGSRIPIARGVGKAFQDSYFSFMFHD